MVAHGVKSGSLPRGSDCCLNCCAAVAGDEVSVSQPAICVQPILNGENIKEGTPVTKEGQCRPVVSKTNPSHHHCNQIFLVLLSCEQDSHQYVSCHLYHTLWPFPWFVEDPDQLDQENWQMMSVLLPLELALSLVELNLTAGCWVLFLLRKNAGGLEFSECVLHEILPPSLCYWLFSVRKPINRFIWDYINCV